MFLRKFLGSPGPESSSQARGQETILGGWKTRTNHQTNKTTTQTVQTDQNPLNTNTTKQTQPVHPTFPLSERNKKQRKKQKPKKHAKKKKKNDGSTERAFFFRPRAPLQGHEPKGLQHRGDPRVLCGAVLPAVDVQRPLQAPQGRGRVARVLEMGSEARRCPGSESTGLDFKPALVLGKKEIHPLGFSLPQGRQKEEPWFLWTHGNETCW